MESAWLESFIALCEHQSFTRAAAAQHVSQPAFSRRIRALERWVGTDLFDRSTFPIALTEAGASLRLEAAAIVESITAMRLRLAGIATPQERTIHVSTSHTLAAYFFPAWWRQVSAPLGDTQVRLSPMDTFDAYDSLVNGGCDLLLTYVDPLQPALSGAGPLESVTVANDTFGPYVPVRHGRPVYHLPRHVGEVVPLVAHGPTIFLGRISDRLLGEERGRYRTTVQTDLTPVVAQLVADGAGVGWLPSTVADDLVRAGRIAQISAPEFTARLDIRVTRRSDSRSDPQLYALWDAICSIAERYANSAGVPPV